MDYLNNAQDGIDKYFKEHTLPDYFYQCFFGELIKVLGIKGLIPDKYYDAEYDDDGNIIESNCEYYSYIDQLDYYLTFIGGTAAWHSAFKLACSQCDLESTLYKYYSELGWIESDLFDGLIINEMLNVLFSENRESDNNYYKFTFDKLFA